MSNGAMIGPTINEQTLKALRIAGQSFPIPSVAVAVGIALAILEVVQTMKINKQEFLAIGRDSCFLMETVIQRVQVDQNGQTFDDPVALRHTDMLIVDLRYIEERVRKVKGRSGVRRMFDPRSEQKIIQDCRECLMRSMMLFGLQYNIEIYRHLASVHNLLIMMLEASSYPLSPPIQPQPQWQIPSPSRFPSPPHQLQGVPNAMLSDLTGSSTGTGPDSFRNTENHHSLSVGDTRDDSFNVFGNFNIINFSVTR